MNKIISLTRKELVDIFSSPIGYLILGTFVATITVFFGTNVFIENFAEMRFIFELLPLFLIVFAAAITMRSWAEEKGNGTIELLFSQPFTNNQLIWAKFLSAFMVLSFGLVLTLVIPIVLNLLGQPDNGVIAGGYLASLVLIATYVLIGQFVSLNTENQIVAFIVTTFILTIFNAIGELVFLQFIPSNLHNIFTSISIGSHFDSIARGIIDSRDVFYFATFIVGLVLITSWRIRYFRNRGS